MINRESTYKQNIIKKGTKEVKEEHGNDSEKEVDEDYNFFRGALYFEFKA